VDENGATSGWGSAANWRPDGVLQGTPGQPGSALPGFPTVVIHEALTHTDLPSVDAIELHNSGPTSAAIDGWYLTDDSDNPKKFRIPAGTTIPPGGYALYDENDFNDGSADAFRISSLGDDLYLFSADASGELTGYMHGVEFGAAQNGVSFGRHVNSVGAPHFVAQLQRTLGSANSGPRVGPVVINELMYHPAPVFGTNNNTRDEFVELRNVTGQSVTLFDPNAPTNTWRLRGGVDFDFPADLTLGPDGHVVLVSFDPVWRPGDLNAFRSSYGIGPEVLILGPYDGLLENGGEAVRLLRPDPPQTLPGPEFGQVPYVLVDEIEYSNVAPWPVDAGATGKSIERVVIDDYGNDPANWRGTQPSPGSSSTITNPDTDGDGLPNVWESAHGLDPNSSMGDDGAGGDPDGDGMSNIEEYQAGTHPNDSLSYLKVESINEESGDIQIRFRVVAGKSYSVLWRGLAGAGTWQKLADIPVQTESVEIQVIDPNATEGQRFYRVVTPQQ
jgi:hypothetical protein